MSELTVIRHALNPDREGARFVKLSASRQVLAKRRWRGTAEDGREFGFDLDQPLRSGQVFFIDGTTSYILQQAPEPVLRISVTTPDFAARVGWMLGNLHFPVDLQPGAIHVQEDPAAVQALERESIPFTRALLVFQPFASAGHEHTHQHHD